jgi:hypothetical protein
MGEEMTANNGHLSEEELVEHYYGEDRQDARVERHLRACPTCAREYSALQKDLGGVKALVPPSRGETYGEEVWQSIRGSLQVYEAPRSRWQGFRAWRPMVFATGFTLLMFAAFVGGRVWQQRRQVQTVAVAGDPQARQRVVVLVLGDHLDRSERLLVELNHADEMGAAAALPMQEEARELLAANRLVRQSARLSGDLALDAALDRLERLLVEVANEPDGLSDADLKRLREEMNTDGLLFDVRVLRSRVMEQQSNAATGLKGVSI